VVLALSERESAIVVRVDELLDAGSK